jgi:hypothetical protein
MTLLAQQEEALQQAGRDATAHAAAGTGHAGLALPPQQTIRPLGNPFRVPTTARSI